MSTIKIEPRPVGPIKPAPPSPMYPLIFEVTDGPSFQRIADAAKYYHDPEVRISLKFTGTLTDTRTGRRRKVKLTAKAWGFFSGTDYQEGGMVIFLLFPGYFIRYGAQFSYNWRERKGVKPLELGRKEKKN